MASTLCLLGLAMLATSAAADIQPDTHMASQRGPQIFNAVADALRKWGTELRPNGMSVYLATIPEGTMLYHGNNPNETPTKFDWLAYDINHAEMFARDRSGFPGPRPDCDGDRPQDGHSSWWWPFPSKGTDQFNHRHGTPAPPPPHNNGEIQMELAKRSSEDQYGWLHVYRTTRALPFLYVDGLSGNKDDNGVNDTQDRLLRGKNTTEGGSWPPRGPDGPPGSRRKGPQIMRGAQGDKGHGIPGETERVAELCELCAAWKLQGIIRTETPGFEVIKCDFPDGLEEVQSLARTSNQDGPEGRLGGGPGHGPGGPGRRPGSGPAPSDRYLQIQSSRTAIDFSSMVSAYFFPVNLSNPDPDEAKSPRLSYATQDELATIKEYLSNVVESRRELPITTTDWRDVADTIIARYADRLTSMYTKVDSIEAITREIQWLLQLFIDDSIEDTLIRDSEAEERCTNFFIQTAPIYTESDRMIRVAFEAVNAEICATLFKARETALRNKAGDKATLKEVKGLVGSLRETLAWSVFVKST